MYTLIYQDAGESKRAALPPGETVVGRAITCDVVINDASISRWHARFSVNGDACEVVDVGSRNGTFLNGDQLTTAAHLTDGDRLILGRLPVQVEYSASDQLSVSEDQQLLELPGTMFKQIDRPESVSESSASVDAGRLLMLMSEIARTLVKTQPLPDVLNRVVDLAFETVSAERVYLMLRDEASGELVARVVRFRDGTPNQNAMISRTIVNRVMTERVAMLAANAQLDSRLNSALSIQAQNIRSFMCAPLWNQNDVIGLLYLDTPRSKKFSESDFDLFTALSNYAAVAIEQARLTARVLEEQRRRERLQRYHSPAVVTRILQSGGEADAPFLAQDRDLSVIFADLVGFTSLSEGMAPQEVALLLNSFFTRMTDVIFEHDGTLDKFIGDAILAVFGAPLDQPDHAVRAVTCAIGMHRALTAFNETQFGPPLAVRMAINSGVAMAGDIGAPKRRDYTVLGDVVNTASRMEGDIAKPGQILISGATFRQLNGAIDARSLGTVPVRGREKPVEIFEVVL
jgi:adenylate cyclase